MQKRIYFIVFLQLLFIGLFLASGPWLASNFYLLEFEAFALILGLWAVFLMMMKSRFSGFPQPHQKAKLIAVGPYRYIRNPMYTGILLTMIALLWDNFSAWRLICFTAEAAILIYKIGIEEKLLARKFKEYNAYKARTYRLIPFIY